MNPPTVQDDTQTRSHDRASFQSPMRASLARSHPEILARGISRSPTRTASKRNQSGQQEHPGSRVFGLRDRKALRPSLTSTASPMNGPRLSGGSPLLSPGRLSNVFAAPPRRVSRKIVPSDLNFGSPVARRNTNELAHENTPEDQLASELDSATGAMGAHGDLDHPSLHEVLEEPELPPTPTQLGLENPPGRPRGLLSSSPTSRHGKRSRRRTTDTLQPSPLKFKDAGFDLDDLSEFGLAANENLMPETALKKQKLKRELSTEIRRLKDDIETLEGWSERISQPDGVTEPAGQDFGKLIAALASEDRSHKAASGSRPSNAHISSLLSTLLPFATKAPRTTRQASPSPTNPFALQEPAQTKPYLTVFAPLALTAQSHEVSNSKSEALLETHNLTLASPPPFPPTFYNVSIVYETNPETQSINSIYVPTSSESAKTNIPEVLQRWVNARLENPLMKLDVSGLCWGINRYWEATISRAQIWLQIESNHSQLIAGRMPQPGGSTDGLSHQKGHPTISGLRRLVPHLERTTMLFSTTEKPIKLLISCALTIDEWTSEPQLTPEISVSISSLTDGTSSKIEQEAKKLFQGIINEYTGGATEGVVGTADVDAIVRATGGVIDTLFGAETEGQALTGKVSKKR
ncbi:hypothetical protein ASPWEDRAFT_53189 [Aspergillus wentii DTO 134E9]|uniref:Uncharacterized protein n=1 Tax=Aspergillus wentii DTO 134E9 TaxID=1073089 RepID=A0A1L9RDZ7_ASPWE|nr:uncharacterized protein ASPWEDRAFT_53189 [Aspergillus wentii DTO 134E9]OJJ33150.1 hypothetical protein ASPWEDRAFT_53189 [Aspergillus wentii DTO 134E9]